MIPLKQVIQAMEEASEAYTLYLDTQTGKTVYLQDYFVTGETDEALAMEIEDNHGRFLRFPDQYEIHEYSIMEQFAESLSPGKAQEELAYAIRGKGAFRRFKSSLRYFGLEQRWYDFKAEIFREKAIRWCRDNDVKFEDEEE